LSLNRWLSGLVLSEVEVAKAKGLSAYRFGFAQRTALFRIHSANGLFRLRSANSHFSASFGKRINLLALAQRLIYFKHFAQ